MSPDGLYEKLALNKQLLEVAAARFDTLTDGLEHPRIDTARDRLRASGIALTEAAGGISGWTRTWLDIVVCGLAAWAVAAAGELMGLSPGWVITVSVAVVSALFWPANALNNALANRQNRRRTKRPASPLEIVAPPDLDPAASNPPRCGLTPPTTRWRRRPSVDPTLVASSPGMTGRSAKVASLRQPLLLTSTRPAGLRSAC